MPVREFQASFDISRTIGSSYIDGGGTSPLSGAKMDDIMDRLRLRGIGAMTAIPTIQGGLSLAASYDSPFAFDDFSVYGYVDRDGADNIDDYRRYGDLNRWSIAFGVQVAPKIAAGLAVSIVTGEDAHNSAIVEFKEEQKYKYLGYSLTWGLMYRPTDYLSLGLNINTMMGLDFEWKCTTDWVKFGEDSLPASFSDKASGKAYRAPYGALGLGLTLPWMIAAFDFRLIMPYTFILPGSNIPRGLQSREFKAGAGLGVEAPLPISAPVVLRAGYSIDECDLFTLVHEIDKEVEWYEEYWREFSPGLKHSFSVGSAVFTSGTGFELSYGYQIWSLKQVHGYTLKQTYSNHRVMGAIIFRY